jgi:carboxylate-amine ligase
MMSARTPIFRHFPRVGVPPHYGSWEIYSSRVELMMAAGAIEDYTYLWWDVRPHPDLGTVEIRVFDQQTRLEDTIALASLAISLAHRYAANFDDEKPLVEVPTELIDDNKVRAALRGCAGALAGLDALLESGTGARRQLRVLEERGGVDAVIRSLCDEATAGLR